MLGRPGLLRVRLWRMACSGCDRRAEWVSWLEHHARLSLRLVEAVALWCGLPVRHAVEMFGLHWSTVRLLEWSTLEARLATLQRRSPDGW